MKVQERHLNAVGVCHGGVLFTLGDLAFAIASNTYGKVALALQAQVSFMRPAKPGDTLIAVAREFTRTRHTALYHIEIHREEDGKKQELQILVWN